MNHFVHCCSFSTSNKITSKGCQSASKTCDFDAKNAKFFWGGGTAPSPDPSPSGEGDTHSPHPTPLGAFGASILTLPILKFCLRYCRTFSIAVCELTVWPYFMLYGNCSLWYTRSTLSVNAPPFGGALTDKVDLFTSALPLSSDSKSVWHI